MEVCLVHFSGEFVRKVKHYFPKIIEEDSRRSVNTFFKKFSNRRPEVPIHPELYIANWANFEGNLIRYEIANNRRQD